MNAPTAPRVASRVALVTGGGNGVGAVIAETLHAAGYRVGIGDIDLPAAQALAAKLGGDATAFTLDVRRKPDFERALKTLTDRWHDVHLLVNNAALTIARPAMAIDADEFDAIMAVNVRGTFLGCQVFGAYFRSRNHGRIVNMSSLAGQNGGTSTGVHYAASKGAIVAMTKVFARELGPAGVTVNAIAPGPLDTEIVHRTLDATQLAGLRAAIPTGDIGDPRFVANLVLLLASPEAAFANGATWDVNGGLYLR